MLELIPRDHDHKGKLYVPVWAYYNAAGDIRPLAIRLGDQRVMIDRVLDVRPGASRKAGGAGLRYLCRAEDKVFALYLETDRWFLET